MVLCTWPSSGRILRSNALCSSSSWWVCRVLLCTAGTENALYFLLLKTLFQSWRDHIWIKWMKRDLQKNKECMLWGVMSCLWKQDERSCVFYGHDKNKTISTNMNSFYIVMTSVYNHSSGLVSDQGIEEEPFKDLCHRTFRVSLFFFFLNYLKKRLFTENTPLFHEQDKISKARGCYFVLRGRHNEQPGINGKNSAYNYS